MKSQGTLLRKREHCLPAYLPQRRFYTLCAMLCLGLIILFTDSGKAQGLPAPALSSPSNNATNQASMVMLSWRRVTGATKYEIHASTDRNFVTGSFLFRDSSYTDTAKPCYGVTTTSMIYWRVRARNSSQVGEWSEVRALTAADFIATNPVSPAKGSTGLALNPTLSWEAISAATRYQLEVSGDSSFSGYYTILNDTGVTATSRQLSGLQAGKKYFWRVRGRTNTQRSARSEVWWFTTAGSGSGGSGTGTGGSGGGGGNNSTVPAAVTLSQPVNNAANTVLALTLSWYSVSGAAKYEIQVSTNTNFAASTIVLSDTACTTNSKQISGLQPLTPYYWRVRAKSSTQTGSWSPVWNFTTALTSLSTQLPSNPVMFVTQVPIVDDFTTVASAFGNHRGSSSSAPRGGDLYIRYPNGTLKNITAAAGYGIAGENQTGSAAIAVREPSISWDGTKALFSMVVGAPASQWDATNFYWQIYEVTGLGQNETPVITKVPNQPSTFNNVSPIYGTNGRIIFTSDRPRNGALHLYPQLDEYERAPVNSGLWSLDPESGDLVLLDHSPSGDFSPSIDSYGRLIFTRWDHMQRDQEADIDKNSNFSSYGSFNYSSEAADAQIQYRTVTEYFPESRYSGGNVAAHTFNQFFPWQINEDGSEAETMNHVGRHELMSGYLNVSFTDDPNLKSLVRSYSGSRNYIKNFMQMREDPTRPGLYFGTDAHEFFTHGSGQIIAVIGAPTLDPAQMVVAYITHQVTRGFIDDAATPTANHTGHYRDPLPLTNGAVIAAHTSENRIEKNMGTTAFPSPRYNFRLKTLKQVGSYWQADSTLTPGISKTAKNWMNGVWVTNTGNLWEMYPVEIVARTKPATRMATLPSLEQQVLSEESVNEKVLRSYLKKNNLAVVVTRDITDRNIDDTHQPFYLKVANSTKQSPNASGKVYTVAHVQFFQGDQIRGGGMYNQNSTPRAGRRILAVAMHDPAVNNPANPGGPAGSVKISADGSIAACVPAHRAMTWQLTDTSGNAVVRERYWVSFKAGEIRACASCHGQNDGATSPRQQTPHNKPEALRSLLQYLKAQSGSSVSLAAPANDTVGVPVSSTLRWNETAVAAFYRVQIAGDSAFGNIILDADTVLTSSLNYAGLAADTKYYWRVRATTLNGQTGWSAARNFTTLTSSPQAGGSATGINEEGLPGRLDLNILPNPVADYAEIRFGTQLQDMPGRVRIDIFDARGNMITTVFDGESSAENSVIFFTRNMAAGSYYCRIESGGYSGIRKFTVVK